MVSVNQVVCVPLMVNVDHVNHVQCVLHIEYIGAVKLGRDGYDCVYIAAMITLHLVVFAGEKGEEFTDLSFL